MFLAVHISRQSGAPWTPTLGRCPASQDRTSRFPASWAPFLARCSQAGGCLRDLPAGPGRRAPGSGISDQNMPTAGRGGSGRRWEMAGCRGRACGWTLLAPRWPRVAGISILSLGCEAIASLRGQGQGYRVGRRKARAQQCSRQRASRASGKRRGSGGAAPGIMDEGGRW